MTAKPAVSNQRETATHEQRADRVVAVFKTTMATPIPRLSEAALHHLIVEAIEAAEAQVLRERRTDQDDEIGIGYTVTGDDEIVFGPQ